MAAALYDKNGKLFVKYPESQSVNAFPIVPEGDGYRFEHSSLVAFQPVVQGENKRLGTLYLKSDLGAMYERLRLYASIALLVIIVSLLLAYLLSRTLQRQISRPILALAETARAVSEHPDYSVRASKFGADELGLLTDAFNQMLTQIQEQDQALRGSEARVRAVLDSAISAVLVIDAAGRVIDWNARAETMFGWTRNEAVGLQLVDTIIPPRYREEHQRGMKHFLASGKGPVLNRIIELSALRRDGNEFPVELSISPLKTGEVVTFCGFITDISTRKQSAQKLQAQLARLELLNQITRAVAERQELQSIFTEVIRNLEDNLQVDFCCICLHDQTDKAFTITSVGSNALPGGPTVSEHTSIAIDQNGFSGCVEGQLVYEPDISRLEFPLSPTARSRWIALNRGIAIVGGKTGVWCPCGCPGSSGQFQQSGLRVSETAKRSCRLGGSSGANLRETSAGLRRLASDSGCRDATGAAAIIRPDGQRYRA